MILEWVYLIKWSFNLVYLVSVFFFFLYFIQCCIFYKNIFDYRKSECWETFIVDVGFLSIDKDNKCKKKIKNK